MRKFGPGICGICLGVNYPETRVEKKNIHVSLDLTSSTTIAREEWFFEIYSLIQQCFYDFK